MKVILQRDIPKVGKHGDVVNVADGYARNYLFPRQLAVSASGGALKAHQARMDRDKEKTAKQLGDAQSQAERMQDLTLTIIGKVGTGTKLYGSITAQDVADAIEREKGVTVDKRRVGLVDPIKTLGTYNVPVRLHSDVSVPVTVEVVTEEQLELRKRQAESAAAQAPAEPAPTESQETPAEAETLETAEQAAENASE
jgi:large subunit ribosomal protein L9